MAAGRYYTAYLRLLDSPREEELRGLVATLRRRGGEFYMGQARSRMARGETARAYLEAVKGLELAPDHPGLFDTHRDARDAQLERLKTHVAVPTFGTPRDQPDLGAQFSDALISFSRSRFLRWSRAWRPSGRMAMTVPNAMTMQPIHTHETSGLTYS